MSGRHSRNKGKRGEREIATALRDAWPWLDPRRGQQSRQGDDACDVEGTPFWAECKRQARPNPAKALEQATADTDGRTPVAFTKRDRGEWLVTMRLEDWIEWVGQRVARETLDDDEEAA